MTARHILVATLVCHDGDHHDPHCFIYRVECPTVTDDCRLWDDCAACDGASPPSKGGMAGLNHGVRHVLRDGLWVLPLERCWWEQADISGHMVEDLTISRPGRYQMVSVLGGGFRIVEG